MEESKSAQALSLPRSLRTVTLAPDCITAATVATTARVPRARAMACHQRGGKENVTSSFPISVVSACKTHTDSHAASRTRSIGKRTAAFHQESTNKKTTGKLQKSTLLCTPATCCDDTQSVLSLSRTSVMLRHPSATRETKKKCTCASLAVPDFLLFLRQYRPAHPPHTPAALQPALLLLLLYSCELQKHRKKKTSGYVSASTACRNSLYTPSQQLATRNSSL